MIELLAGYFALSIATAIINFRLIAFIEKAAPSDKRLAHNSDAFARAGMVQFFFWPLLTVIVVSLAVYVHFSGPVDD